MCVQGDTRLGPPDRGQANGGYFGVGVFGKVHARGAGDGAVVRC
jgi:hypothetical protein